ncbi:uncharacterized protein TNCV_2318561 [Trichonephila clavipes]|nr:uncharacterized protein TNCV_2318561 [Trichonephila clavipes]
MGSPHTNTIVITAKIESGFSLSSLKTTWFLSAAFQFPRAWHHSKWKRRWVRVKGRTRDGHCDPKCPSDRRLCMVREDTGDPSEGAIRVWMAADEAVGCTCAFFTMWRSSRGLVCGRHPEPGFRVNVISWIHWSQHLLTTLPNMYLISRFVTIPQLFLGALIFLSMSVFVID